MSRDRLVQHHGARKRVEGWHAVFVEGMNNRFGVGCATCRKHGRHVFLFNQLARICRSEFGLKLASKRNQFYFLSASTAFCIDGVNKELCSIRRLLDASARGTGKSGCVSDQDFYQPAWQAGLSATASGLYAKNSFLLCVSFCGEVWAFIDRKSGEKLCR